MAEAPACRYCWEGVGEGPGGLRDLLLEPCDYAGSVKYAHASCLFRWQLSREGMLQDPHTCEVCRGAFRVPPGAYDALVADNVLTRGDQVRLGFWRPLHALLRAAWKLSALPRWACCYYTAGVYFMEALELAHPIWQRPALVFNLIPSFLVALCNVTLATKTYMALAGTPRERQRHEAIGDFGLCVLLGSACFATMALTVKGIAGSDLETSTDLLLEDGFTFYLGICATVVGCYAGVLNFNGLLFLWPLGRVRRQQLHLWRTALAAFERLDGMLRHEFQAAKLLALLQSIPRLAERVAAQLAG